MGWGWGGWRAKLMGQAGSWESGEQASVLKHTLSLPPPGAPQAGPGPTPAGSFGCPGSGAPERRLDEKPGVGLPH